MGNTLRGIVKDVEEGSAVGVEEEVEVGGGEEQLKLLEQEQQTTVGKRLTEEDIDIPPTIGGPATTSELRDHRFLSTTYSLHTNNIAKLDRCVQVYYDYLRQYPVVTISTTKCCITLNPYEWVTLCKKIKDIRKHLYPAHTCNISYISNIRHLWIHLRLQQVFGKWYLQISQENVQTGDITAKVYLTIKDFERLVSLVGPINIQLRHMKSMRAYIYGKLYGFSGVANRRAAARAADICPHTVRLLRQEIDSFFYKKNALSEESDEYFDFQDILIAQYDV